MAGRTVKTIEASSETNGQTTAPWRYIGHRPRLPRAAIVLLLVAPLTLGGCSTVSRATDTVASKTRAAVSAVTRGAKKTISRIRGRGASRPEASGRGGFDLTGILMVVDDSSCPQGQDCGPRYQLFNEDFSVRTALSGELHEVHDGLLVTVNGEWQSNGDGALPGENWRRPDEVIAVSDYDIHTGVRIRSFLSREAAEYGNRVHNCTIRWPSRFGWQIVNNEPYLILRFVDPQLNGTSGRFVELWYHGDTGRFLRETKSHADTNPCRG